MNDFSFLFAFTSYNCATFTSGVSWLVYGTQAGRRYDSKGKTPSSWTISVVYAISFIPWILSWWLFARTEFDKSISYYVAMSLVMAGLACEKLWLAFEMQWNYPKLAKVLAFTTSLLYGGATIAMGITGGGGDNHHWEHIPGIVMTSLATIWFGFVAII